MPELAGCQLLRRTFQTYDIVTLEIPNGLTETGPNSCDKLRQSPGPEARGRGPTF